MRMKIGKKIRELRKARSMSQEALAQLLGVSFQTVSKWENGISMPDVSMIPVLASLFGISTDELFDYDRLEIERKVQDICIRATEIRDSDNAKSEAILRDGLKQFPGNEVILNHLLYTMHVSERSEEMISLCKTLIAFSRDDEVKFDAIRILAYTYHKVGLQALVEPTLEMLPEIPFTKLEQSALLLEGDKSFNAAAKHMATCLKQMIEMLLVMRDRLKEQSQYVDADKYYSIAKRVVEVFQQEEGDAGQNSDFYHFVEEVRGKLL